MKKKDFVLLSVILAVVLISFLVIEMMKEEGAYVVVRVEGNEVARYELSQDGEYVLNGGTNVLLIEDGTARLISATCPDHLCVNKGRIDKSGETITCLPYRLTVTVYGAKKSDVELVA